MVINALDLLQDYASMMRRPMARGMVPPDEAVGVMGSPEVRERAVERSMSRERSSDGPMTYVEFIASVMVKDADERGTFEDFAGAVRSKPFEYVVGVWGDPGKQRTLVEITDGLVNLRERWLAWIVAGLPPAEREGYGERLYLFWKDEFGNRDRLDGDESFWRRPGYREIWYISVVLAMVSYLDDFYYAFDDATFLNLELPLGDERFERLASGW